MSWRDCPARWFDGVGADWRTGCPDDGCGVEMKGKQWLSDVAGGWRLESSMVVLSGICGEPI